jgi:exopolysaccharide production protein ExoY
MHLTNKKHQPMETFSFTPARIPRWKRILDIVLILLALPLLLPLAAFVAVLIWAVSSGPILFKQERVGYLGGRFMCLKFRTMFVGVDSAVHQGHLRDLINSNTPMTKMDSQGDQRIIPFGLLLRSSGLDELPQIMNVLRGEMSLVGPRPCLSYEYDKYLPWQQERFATLPGLTGLWQVCGKNKTTFTEMIELDIDYGRKKSLWLDLKIILLTPLAIIIQIWEARQKRKLPSQSPQSKAANQNLQSYPSRKTAFAKVARAEGGDV